MGVALGCEQWLASNGGSQWSSGACISWPRENLGFGGFFGPKMSFWCFWFTFLAVLIHFFGKILKKICRTRNYLSNAHFGSSVAPKLANLIQFVLEIDFEDKSPEITDLAL